MKRSCEHCGELIVGNAYRVTSEEDNVTLLDMVVCSLFLLSLFYGGEKTSAARGANQYEQQHLRRDSIVRLAKYLQRSCPQCNRLFGNRAA